MSITLFADEYHVALEKLQALPNYGSLAAIIGTAGRSIVVQVLRNQDYGRDAFLMSIDRGNTGNTPSQFGTAYSPEHAHALLNAMQTAIVWSDGGDYVASRERLLTEVRGA